ncbi:hypothetical protein GQ53DRAFT_760894 [Thozetella sp. PMI_491]|nr:hypothetical protein GQ53DRAFT_760894 [Thozetella sp. PMI_491]
MSTCPNRPEPHPSSAVRRLSRQIQLWRAIQFLLCAANVGTMARVYWWQLVSFWYGRHFLGYERRGCVFMFIMYDVASSIMMVAAFVALVLGGLPWNCHNLSLPSFSPDGHSGSLDRYCKLPQAYFWITLVLFLSFIYTVSLGIRLRVALTRRVGGIREDKIQAQNIPEMAMGLNNHQETIELDNDGERMELPTISPPPPRRPPPVYVVSQNGPSELPSPLHPTQEYPGAVEAVVSNGSWRRPGTMASSSLPRYQPDCKPLSGLIEK